MKIIYTILFLLSIVVSYSQTPYMPEIFSNSVVRESTYLPDFSYAGYHFGEKKIPTRFSNVLNVADFGAIPNDHIDDSEAFQKTIEKAATIDGTVVIKVPSGRFDLSKIVYLDHSNTVVQGSGSGKNGTILHFQRPLRFVPDPPELKELREYLVNLKKRQVEPENGVDLLFSQYAWSGGYFWVGKKGVRVKPYLAKYNPDLKILANAIGGIQGKFAIHVDHPDRLEEGQTYKICWFNKDGEKGSLLKHLYDGQDLEIGSHHWTNPESPLVDQVVLITKIKGDSIYIKDPLLHDVKKEWHCALINWPHIEEVGIENLSFEFPLSPDLPHHIEDGYNAIYLTSLMNGWVRNVRIKNADSGILTDNISNVTIENILTLGRKRAHYSVAMGEVHNVLVKGLWVENKVIHPLSFNTRSTKSVYTNCIVEKQPILDQHGGINEQNLFDNLLLRIDNPIDTPLEYPLFKSGGAKYWQPAHAAFNTFYNICVNFCNVPENHDQTILLDGVNGGVSARIIGVHGNAKIKVEYGPNAYMELTNEKPGISSLYEYQLKQRLKKGHKTISFLMLNEKKLKQNKLKLNGNETAPYLNESYKKLLDEADESLNFKPSFVVDKGIIPPSGDIHDYTSLAPYWWPDESKPNGLPYIRKDGQHNPDTREPRYDKLRMRKLLQHVHDLSYAYYFSNNEKYAKKAIELLTGWFLDSKTRMNPNVNFGQAIPGSVTGRSIGIIDTKSFAYLPDQLTLLKDSKYYSEEFENRMKSWFSNYLAWLWNSPNGQRERIHPNNHGTAYDVQAIALALYVGNIDLAKYIIHDFSCNRLGSQVKSNGSQPLELERTRSFHYSIQNLRNFMEIGLMASRTGIDFLHAKGQKDQSIQKMIHFLLPDSKGKINWNYQQITDISEDMGTFYYLLKIAAQKYSDPIYDQALKAIQLPEKERQFANLII